VIAERAISVICGRVSGEATGADFRNRRARRSRPEEPVQRYASENPLNFPGKQDVHHALTF
jgi:hypothetical protein